MKPARQTAKSRYGRIVPKISKRSTKSTNSATRPKSPIPAGNCATTSASPARTAWSPRFAVNQSASVSPRTAKPKAHHHHGRARSLSPPRIGSRLLEAVESRLAKSGVSEVGLETATDNDSAIAFWQKHGYRNRGDPERLLSRRPRRVFDDRNRSPVSSRQNYRGKFERLPALSHPRHRRRSHRIHSRQLHRASAHRRSSAPR